MLPFAVVKSVHPVKSPVAKSPLVTIAAFAAGAKAELAAMLAQKTPAMSRGSMAYPPF